MKSEITIQDYFETPGQFNRISREYECEVPKGNCWHIIVRHVATQKLFQFYEEDNYYCLRDQIEDNSDPSWSEV